MKILAFSGSNSTSSINQKLIEYVVQHLQIQTDIIDLRNYDIPMFGIDEEFKKGFPNELQLLYDTLSRYDAYIISIPEHNGNYPAFLKNIIDWLTRVESCFFGGKPILLLNASPGPNGGKSVLSIAEKSFPFFGGNVIDTFILPQFNSLIPNGKIKQVGIIKELNSVINKFEKVLISEYPTCVK